MSDASDPRLHERTGAKTFFARFATPLQWMMTLGLYAQLAVIYAVAAFPSLYLVTKVWAESAAWAAELRLLVLAAVVGAGFFLFAIVLLFVVGFVRVVTFAGVPLGRFPYYSPQGMRWATYNALILAVRFTVMDFLRVTPLLVLFHRMMGMRIGARVQINTKIIGDSNLIEIGDDSIIGGDATLVCHAAERGQLFTAPVKIGSRVTVGLMAVVFPGCEIGDGAVIAAGAILPKGTTVPPNTVWAGVPAKQVGERKSRSAEPGTNEAT
jgi:non-ribosomal peptide synthetase-like protein